MSGSVPTFRREFCRAPRRADVVPRAKGDPRNTRNHANRPEIGSQMTEVRKMPSGSDFTSFGVFGGGLSPRRTGAEQIVGPSGIATICLVFHASGFSDNWR